MNNKDFIRRTKPLFVAMLLLIADLGLLITTPTIPTTNVTNPGLLNLINTSRLLSPYVVIIVTMLLVGFWVWKEKLFKRGITNEQQSIKA